MRRLFGFAILVSATLLARSSGAQGARRISFLNDVEPILTRAGCNQGSCHGSQFGKGGFKLSLAGYDPDFDHIQIVRQAGGRRVNRTMPAASLVLRKPALVVAHQGGLRLAQGTADYRAMLRWLADSAPGPNPRDPVVTSIRAVPDHLRLVPGQAAQLKIVAGYSDGSKRDVTAHTRISSLNDAVAPATPEGLVTAKRRGATAVMLRYSGLATVTLVSVPFANNPVSFKGWKAEGFVDRAVENRWRDMGLAPSGVCSDTEFLRRASLDIIGTLPTADEVRAFLSDRSPDKRARLINRLLDRPEYADYQALKWSDLLRNNRTVLGARSMWALNGWIRQAMASNMPFDRFARELLTARGLASESGPANYYRVATTPQDLTETTAQLFLGVRLQCAKCHHHPFEKWSQQDYYQFAAYFARVGQKGSQEFGIFGNEQVVRINKGGEVYHPKSGQKMVPTPLGGYPERMRVHDTKTAALIDPDPDSGGDRRAVLADWITQDNPLFARNIVNRYWGYLMGRGLVEPIDDQRITNPPTNPELLDALAKDLVDHKYDVKHILRTICNSRAYQLSSEPTVANLPDTSFYTHYTVKRLPAESLFDAVNIATGTQEKFNDLPLGTRAIQLPDPNVSSYFLDTFGRAPRIIACECERAPEPNMSQALHLMMGEMLNRKVQDGNALPAKLLAEKKSDPEILQAFYYTALGRPPRPDEAYKAEALLKSVVDRPGFVPAKPWYWLQPHKFDRVPDAKARDRKQTLEDIYWALLNSKEFIFNH